MHGAEVSNRQGWSRSDGAPTGPTGVATAPRFGDSRPFVVFARSAVGP